MSLDLGHSPDAVFAVAAALLWAVAAQVVRRALAEIPGDTKLPSIILGICVGLITGSLTLLVLTGGAPSSVAFSPWLVASGVLLFPIGTGLYYLCGHAFAGRAEFAAQFSNVKPILSVVLGALLLGEAFSLWVVVPLLLTLIGVGVMIYAVKRGTFSPLSLVLGLLLALAWGGGEILAKLGGLAGSSLDATFWAVLSGTAVTLLLTLPSLIWLKGRAFNQAHAWLPLFALHGVVSFGLSYAFLFESISRIGVGRTALITAFWPSLAILMARRKNGAKVPRAMWLAAALLLAGSLLVILGRI